jgi:hypothetical protein
MFDCNEAFLQRVKEPSEEDQLLLKDVKVLEMS